MAICNKCGNEKFGRRKRVAVYIELAFKTIKCVLRKNNRIDVASDDQAKLNRLHDKIALFSQPFGANVVGNTIRFKNNSEIRFCCVPSHCGSRGNRSNPVNVIQ